MTSKFTERAIDCADPTGLAPFLDRDEEVRRLLDLGARHADVGKAMRAGSCLPTQRGNEFCVLADPPPLIGGRTPRQTYFRSPIHAHYRNSRAR